MVDCPTGFGLTPSWQRLDMVPIGGIIAWAGAIVDIPAAYQLCDGTNGTPDLQDQCIRGAGNLYAVGDHGGSPTHNHAAGAAIQVTDGAGPHVWVDQVSADGDSFSPHYDLAYIQRIT